MSLGMLAKKTLSSALGITTEQIDAAQEFATKLKSDKIDREKGIKVIEKVSKLEPEELNVLLNKVDEFINAK